MDRYIGSLWPDGVCKKCGSLVIETSAYSIGIYDYMNTCTNPDCKEFKWHGCHDMETLEYYEHDFE